MNQENFCYWLKGYFEIGRADSLTPNQVQEIRNHLDLALNKSKYDMSWYPESLRKANIERKAAGLEPLIC